MSKFYDETVLPLRPCYDEEQTIEDLIGCLENTVNKLKFLAALGWEYGAGSDGSDTVVLVKERVILT